MADSEIQIKAWMALERIKSIVWYPELQTNSIFGSHRLLTEEFLRWMALWHDALNPDKTWNSFDVAHEVAPDGPYDEKYIAELSDYLETCDTYHTENNICTWYIYWSQIEDQERVQRYNLPPPYDPVIWLYERGGFFTYDHAGVKVDAMYALSPGIKSFLQNEPFVELDTVVLDEADRRKPFWMR